MTDPAGHWQQRSGVTKKTRTLEKIQDAAIALVAEKGWHNIRMEDIAARAGLGLSTVYNHFSGKSELGDSLVGRGTTVPVADLRSALRRMFHEEFPELPKRLTDRMISGVYDTVIAHQGKSHPLHNSASRKEEK